MCTSTNRISRTARLSFVFGTLCVSGCLYPGTYYGRPYGQPMYAPPRTLNPGAPGTLYIPESGQPYVPNGGTYNADPGDDFRQSDDGQFYKPGEDDVPFPPDSNGGVLGDDDLGPSTRWDSKTDGTLAAAVARPVSATLHPGSGMPVEYGFDTAEYRWLRGVLHREAANQWSIVYSVAGTDQFGGTFRLSVAASQLADLNDGDPVDVHGQIDQSRQDRDGRPVYRVDDIRLMATRVAL